MSRHSIHDQPMTSAERQACYRARKARECNQAVREQLYAARGNLGKLTRYLVLQGDPLALGAMLAELDGPPLPIAMLAEATAWMTAFTAAYRHGAGLQQASAKPDPLAKHLWPTPE